MIQLNQQPGDSIDPKLSFLAGWLLGRRGRRRAKNQRGIGCLLLIVGAFAGLAAIGGIVSAPFTWMEARSVRALPQPTASEVVELTQGSQAILVGQAPQEPIAPDLDDASLPPDFYGLVLFYVETKASRSSDTSDTVNADAGVDINATPTSAFPDWVRVVPPPQRVQLTLDRERSIIIQLPQDIAFLNAQTIDELSSDILGGEFDDGQNADDEWRVVGYLPGQALTVKGTWEGASIGEGDVDSIGLFTAEAVYAGSADEYLSYLGRQPGMGLLMGFGCGSLAIVLLLAGAALRFVGR
ncbi:MAG: hypothetical protein AAF639_01505 [Chloroflexota bacterium]